MVESTGQDEVWDSEAGGRDKGSYTYNTDGDWQTCGDFPPKTDGEQGV